uniref:Chemokine interleukin-8-like domain-containing protein n=1 Tax=Hucho hucho TaxID=62062 RepID=A0A4W5M470_9TELE
CSKALKYFVLPIQPLNVYFSVSVSCRPSPLRCRCVQKVGRRIERFISKIKLYPPSSSCNRVEVIATLKTSGQEICLELSAPWVPNKVTDNLL